MQFVLSPLNATISAVTPVRCGRLPFSVTEAWTRFLIHGSWGGATLGTGASRHRTAAKWTFSSQSYDSATRGLTTKDDHNDMRHSPIERVTSEARFPGERR